MTGGTPFPPGEGCPALSNADIVKLHAATMLAICGGLEAAGLLAQEEVARILATQVLDREREPWALVVSALSQVLARQAHTSLEVDPGPASGPVGFTVIQGGAP